MLTIFTNTTKSKIFYTPNKSMSSQSIKIIGKVILFINIFINKGSHFFKEKELQWKFSIDIS